MTKRSGMLTLAEQELIGRYGCMALAQSRLASLGQAGQRRDLSAKEASEYVALASVVSRVNLDRTVYTLPRNMSLEELRVRIGRERRLQLGVRDATITITRATTILSWFSALVPQRIAREQLGDLCESICRRRARGEGPVRIYLALLAGMGWATVHTIGYFRQTIRGRKVG